MLINLLNDLSNVYTLEKRKYIFHLKDSLFIFSWILTIFFHHYSLLFVSKEHLLSETLWKYGKFFTRGGRRRLNNLLTWARNVTNEIFAILISTSKTFLSHKVNSIKNQWQKKKYNSQTRSSIMHDALNNK